MTALFFLLFMLPFVGLALFAVPFSTLFLLAHTPSVTLARMSKGYLCAILASLLVVCMGSYVPYEASESHAEGTPETYGRELSIHLQVWADVVILYTLIVTAVVLAPIAFTLLRRGFGSVTWVAATSGLVSLVIVPLFLLVFYRFSVLQVSTIVGMVACTNVLLALSFSFGLGLPFLRVKAELAPPLPRGPR